jgi:glycosyltransferase involved in cell wall biosynthesis
MKRILVITPFFYPHVGGSQQYMEDLYVTLLRAHNDIKVDVLCYNTDHADSEEVYRGMHVSRISGVSLLPGQFALPNPVKLMQFLSKKKQSYDLIHVSTRFFETAWWAPLYAKYCNTPIILTDHCAYHPVHQNSAVRFIARTIDTLFIPHILKLYTDIFATNHATQAFLQTSLGTRSKVLYGGVDMNKFIRHAERETGEKKRITITYVGRMIESKGVLQLFNVASRHPEYDFVFAGPGALYTALQDEIRKESNAHIQFLGSCKKEEVIALLKRTDLFVHPSYHHEGFPNSLLEAGSMGLPVIATDVGGTKEIIIDGKTGYLIPQKDEKALEEAILILATHAPLREELGQALHTHVQDNFSWEKIAAEHYTYLQEKLS